jgi:translation initiation factor 2D
MTDTIKPVITHSPSELVQGQLVAIHQFSTSRNADETINRVVSPPLAVGRMAVSSEGLMTKSSADEKGKAVLVFHVWKDHLWELGQKGDVPPGSPLRAENQNIKDGEDQLGEGPVPKTETKEAEGGFQPEQDEHGGQGEQGETATDEVDTTPKIAYTPQEITELLTKSLIHAIANLSTLSNATFPIPASQLYTTYILPCRPAYPTSVLIPSAAASSDDAEVDPSEIHIDPSEITIKASSNKSLSSFLKKHEKSSLLTLKASKQKSSGDFVITSVNADHSDVLSYAATKKPFVTVAEIEAKRAKRQAGEEQGEKEREREEREVEVRQLWKPHLGSTQLFEDIGAR